MMINLNDRSLLEALLDSWDRNNAILVNLVRLIPSGRLEVKAMEGSPTVAQILTHLHFVRLVFVLENAPEFAAPMPESEWQAEPDPLRITHLLDSSAQVVRAAVKSKMERGEEMNRHFDHPILLLQHLIWHEGYHHGQIKLALKLAGCPISDEAASSGTWGLWMNKTKS